MTQADPWDEVARLEKQMEAELLAQLRGSRLVIPMARAPRKAPPEAPEAPRPSAEH